MSEICQVAIKLDLLLILMMLARVGEHSDSASLKNFLKPTLHPTFWRRET